MVNIQLSQQLIALRQQAHLSQEQVASQLHVSRQAISKWENGTTLPDIEKIVQLATILNVSLDELVLAKKPTINQSTVAKIIEAYTQQNKQELSWRHQRITNGWEFLARYWYVILIFAVFIYIVFDDLAFQ
ncbi:transcriptional regulator [Limosilactobacillus pontis]|uniref:Transcriptional regulator n=1 Tax=Limosilactobacillus pontis TaxID=35787 RepID=A0A2J6NP92_9LACO|nr:helix-turn-helix domain-containing protein [Limosilactobacillus pontis]PMB83138.1 transcriptional regulator [Limosilactobacillus pontis]